jgi:hypothetical protein
MKCKVVDFGSNKEEVIADSEQHNLVKGGDNKLIERIRELEEKVASEYFRGRFDLIIRRELKDEDIDSLMRCDDLENLKYYREELEGYFNRRWFEIGNKEKDFYYRLRDMGYISVLLDKRESKFILNM